MHEESEIWVDKEKTKKISVIICRAVTSVVKPIKNKFRMSLDEKAIQICWKTQYCKLIIGYCLILCFSLK